MSRSKPSDGEARDGNITTKFVHRMGFGFECARFKRKHRPKRSSSTSSEIEFGGGHGSVRGSSGATRGREAVILVRTTECWRTRKSNYSFVWPESQGQMPIHRWDATLEVKAEPHSERCATGVNRQDVSSKRVAFHLSKKTVHRYPFDLPDAHWHSKAYGRPSSHVPQNGKTPQCRVPTLDRPRRLQQTERCAVALGLSRE